MKLFFIILFCAHQTQPGHGNPQTGIRSCINTNKLSTSDVYASLKDIFKLLIKNFEFSFAKLSSIRYIFYTNDSFEYITKENASILMDFSKPTRIFVHGWNSRPTSNPTQALRKSYLGLHYNFIALDWSHIAVQNYLFGCLLPKASIGKALAEFIDALSADSSSLLQNTVVVGQSCGAHIVGQAGHDLQTNHGKKLPKIISLEAARPGFEFPPLVRPVQKGDADFLYAMYTNPGLFGRKHIYGDFNVKFNHGDCQPQCVQKINIVRTCSLSHLESIFYLADSVENPTFSAKKCSNGFDDCDPNNVVLVTEGINGTGNYFTHATLPFC